MINLALCNQLTLLSFLTIPVKNKWANKPLKKVSLPLKNQIEVNFSAKTSHRKQTSTTNKVREKWNTLLSLKKHTNATVKIKLSQTS